MRAALVRGFPVLFRGLGRAPALEAKRHSAPFDHNRREPHSRRAVTEFPNIGHNFAKSQAVAGEEETFRIGSQVA